MPVNLVPANPEIFAQHRAEAAKSNRVEQIPIRGPWAGYMPDIDPYNSPATACEEIRGLVARPSRFGQGEVLRPDAGYAPTGSVHASTGLPLDTNAGGAGPSTTTDITLLAQFNRTTAVGAETGTEQTCLMAIKAGDGTTSTPDDPEEGSLELYFLDPSDGTTWTLVPTSFTGAGDNPPLASAPSAQRDILPDWAVMPAGMAARVSYNEGVTRPVFVWCGLQGGAFSGDQVMVYPVDGDEGFTANNAEFEPLSEDFGEAFFAETVEYWNGRLYFGNTSESGTQHRQRVRRTALFTADPLSTTVGAGAFDVKDFTGDLVRLEKLGNVMAAYFEDGTAFISKTEIATAPDRVELLRERRGLISKWAVTPISDQVHFGIFTDGWFTLDPTGRWTEVGLMDIQGVPTRKWKDDFYKNLDIANRHRLTIDYDGTYVRIAYPNVNSSENIDVWIYDFRGDRVFKDTYEVTQWGRMNLIISTGINWEDAEGGWDNPTDALGNPLTTWTAQQSRRGLEATIHGTTDGFILTHDSELFTRYNTSSMNQESPSYLYRSKLTNMGDPTMLKTAQKLWLEYVQVNDPQSATILVKGDDTESQEGGAVPLTKGQAGDTNTAWRNFNFTSTNLQFEISGSAPVEIRSFLAEVVPHGEGTESFDQ